MSKLDVSVGDEFPLDELPDNREGGRRHGGGHHHKHHHHWHGHHRHHHGFGRLALLLVIAGLAALIVEHKLPVSAAYGLVGLGAALLAILLVQHWRLHRRMAQVS